MINLGQLRNPGDLRWEGRSGLDDGTIGTDMPLDGDSPAGRGGDDVAEDPRYRPPEDRAGEVAASFPKETLAMSNSPKISKKLPSISQLWSKYGDKFF